MDRVRDQVVDLMHRFENGQRGFLDPSEDDEVNRLWTSYHKARAALIEIVTSLRYEHGDFFREPTADDATRRDEECLESNATEFLIGYAAALVLVNAARMLRDSFRDDDIIRRKLNEGNSRFDIAAGSFDAIQLALTHPSNAVAVRDAGRFYESRRDALTSAAAAEGSTARLIDVIEKLRVVIDVSASEYIAARISDRRSQVRTRLVIGNLTKAIYAVQQWGSRLVSSISTNPGHMPKIPEPVEGIFRELMRAGDVFVTRKECAVTNYFLPGFWPHVAMYVGDDRVVESLKDGVQVRGMESPFGNDCLALIRPCLNAAEISVAIERAHQHVGKPYDFDFDFTRSDRMVCTEVVYRSYDGISGLRFQLIKRAGRQTLSAEDLLRLAMESRSFEVVAVYCPDRDPHVCRGRNAMEILEQTVS